MVGEARLVVVVKAKWTVVQTVVLFDVLVSEACRHQRSEVRRPHRHTHHLSLRYVVLKENVNVYGYDKVMNSYLFLTICVSKMAVGTLLSLYFFFVLFFFFGSTKKNQNFISLYFLTQRWHIMPTIIASGAKKV